MPGVSNAQRADLWNAKLKQDQLNQAVQSLDDDIRKVKKQRTQFSKRVKQLQQKLPGVEKKLNSLLRKQRSNKFITKALTKQAPAMSQEIKELVATRAREDKALKKLGVRVQTISKEMPSIASSVKLLVISRLKNENELKKIRDKVPELETQMKRLTHFKRKRENIKAVQKVLDQKRTEVVVEDANQHLKEMRMIEVHAQHARRAFILANKQRYKDQARANKRRKKLRQDEIDRRKKVAQEGKAQKVYLGALAAIGGAFILLNNNPLF